MQIKDIPQDSILRDFCFYLSLTEIPISYQIAGGLSTIGALIRRNRWVDQVDWRVYPNQSVLFIGPSGVGKDTIINRCQSTVNSLTGQSRVPVIGGVTMELIHARLAVLAKPAAAYIPAPEMTAFFGKADYQANMLTGMTNLLSNGELVDISTKGSYNAQGGASTYIVQPTITMHAGSTVEWLHRGMPDGTLEGGFLGRFLIVIEEFGGRFVPLVKSSRTRAELAELKKRLSAWHTGCEDIIAKCKVARELILYTEAEDAYSNWYYNRFKLFSKAVMPYANRSRDMVLRLAMLMALSRGHDRYIEEEDVEFAISLIAEIAGKIDKVVLPPSVEAKLGEQILAILPATQAEIYNTLGMRYSIAKMIDPALQQLRTIGKVRTAEKGIIRKVVEDD